MTLQPGEIVLIGMQFHQAAGSKVRPAVVLLDTGDSDFVAAPVTSQARNSEFDLAISEWQPAGLNVASTIRLHKLTALAKVDVVRRIGVLSAPDRARLFEVLSRMFSGNVPR
jgi:mRNA interferase MazF